MGYSVRKLGDLSMEAILSCIQQIDEFPSSIPSGLLEMIFAKLTERKLVTNEILDLFIRSPIHSLLITKVRIVGVTINSPICNLRTLRIDTAPLLQQLYIHNAPHLAILSVSRCPVLDTLFVVCPSLTTVYLPDIDCRDNKLKNLLLECSAEFLDLSGCVKLQTCTITSPALVTLDLSANRAISQLQLNCARLPEIDVSKLSEIESLSIKSDELQSLEIDCKYELKELSLEGKNFQKLVIKRCAKLETVNITCPSISTLEVTNQNIVNLKLLTRICLFSQHSLQNISFTNSKDFRITLEDHTSGKMESKLINLDMSNCVGLIDSSLIQLLQNFSNIHVMDLSNTAISDDAVEAIPELCPNIQSLNLTGTAVSVVGVFKLTSRTKCNLIHNFSN